MWREGAKGTIGGKKELGIEWNVTMVAEICDEVGNARRHCRQAGAQSCGKLQKEGEGRVCVYAQVRATALRVRRCRAV